MGQISTYVFSPSDKPGFVQESLAKLTAAEVISSDDDDADSECYGSGEAEWVMDAFDSLGIHQSPLPFIIPQDPAIAPACPGCDADVSDTYYETVNGVGDEGESVDWREVTVTCAGCGQETPLTALKDSVGVYCAREYLYFSDVMVEDLDAFEGKLREVLPDAEVKSYWYT